MLDCGCGTVDVELWMLDCGTVDVELWIWNCGTVDVDVDGEDIHACVSRVNIHSIDNGVYIIVVYVPIHI